MTVRLTQLFSYPVKSCAAIRHTAAGFSQNGLHLDRQWVIVNAQGQFLTQRTHPRMALVQPAIHGNDLHLSAPGQPEIVVPWLVETSDPPLVPVRIWRSDTFGFDEGDAVAAWLGDVLGEPCRLLRVHPQAERVASPDHVSGWRGRFPDLAGAIPERHLFGFADGFPFLVVNQASLDALNAELRQEGQAEADMLRFRPNLVIEGLEPWEEDYLAGVRIGKATFGFVKRCDRCAVPNVNPESAAVTEEPGRTLARLRMTDAGVLFGVNAVVGGMHPDATLHIHDEVEVIYDM